MSATTTAIDKIIYKMVQDSMSKPAVLKKYKEMIGRFINTRNTALYDTFPATRMLYGQQDADDLYSVFGYKPGELENIINNAISETYYSKIANFNPRAAKNPVTVLSMC